jgi:hypothetical protein
VHVAETVAAANHVDQEAVSKEHSNTENGATILCETAAPETVSNEKANNASTPSTNIILSNDATDQEMQKADVMPVVSITPALVDDQINEFKTADKDQLVIDETIELCKSQVKLVDTNKDGDKTFNIDQSNDGKPNISEKAKEEDAVTTMATAKDAVVTAMENITTAAATETVAPSKYAVTSAATTLTSTIKITNTEKDENHDKAECSDAEIKPSSPNTGVTSLDTKTENGLVIKDNKSSVNNIQPTLQSKEEDQCDSVTVGEEEKNSSVSLLSKETVENEATQSQEVIGDEKNEDRSVLKDPNVASEKLSVSNKEQVQTTQAPKKKEDKEAEKKAHYPQITPTISAKNKLLASKEAHQTKGDTVRPSTSRIRPPSTNRGHNGTLISSLPGSKQLLGTERRLRTTSITGTKAVTNGHVPVAAAAGATRIARLSNASTNSSSSSSNNSDQERKPSTALKIQVEKPLSKPFPPVTTMCTIKLQRPPPRVATTSITTTVTQKSLPQAQRNAKSADEKPKKRISSTKNFISRLTAPTLSSANKKADHQQQEAIPQHSSSGMVRRTTTKKQQQAPVKPSRSTSTTKVY